MNVYFSNELYQKIAIIASKDPDTSAPQLAAKLVKKQLDLEEDSQK